MSEAESLQGPRRRAGIRKRFEQIESATVADVLDELGCPNQGVSPEISGHSGSTLAGWAYTIQGESAPYVGSGDPLKMEACQGIGPDEVSVWSGGATGVSYFGEMIAVGMAQRGSVGAILDGGVRDTHWLEEMKFPVFSRYRSSVQSIGRWRVTCRQKPVYLPGAATQRVVVTPGDFVLGDDDGAVVVPAPLVDEVLVRAESVTAAEVSVRKALKSGLSLPEALKKFGHV